MNKHSTDEFKPATLVPAQNQGAANTPSADDPITLAEACKLFPLARLTPSALRAERDRGRLNIFRLGRRDYTTEGDMRAMVRSSREASAPRVARADNGEHARSAAVLNQITSALKRSA